MPSTIKHLILSFPKLIRLHFRCIANTYHPFCPCSSTLAGHAACYFSTELQGIFVTQSTVAENEVTYSQINITDNAIPIWGYCHRRMDNNVILMISSGTEETNCFRCFNIRLVASSKNVVRVHTTDADYISKCYTNEEKAISSCPTEADLTDPSRNTEIILYSKCIRKFNPNRAGIINDLPLSHFQRPVMLKAVPFNGTIAPFRAASKWPIT